MNRDRENPGSNLPDDITVQMEDIFRDKNRFLSRFIWQLVLSDPPGKKALTTKDRRPRPRPEDSNG